MSIFKNGFEITNNRKLNYYSGFTNNNHYIRNYQKYIPTYRYYLYNHKDAETTQVIITFCLIV